jgi:peptidoglycan L-alanyl-D-glutamate endopeptidase CwlK
MNKLGSRSLKNIEGINPKLALVLGVFLARGKYDLTVTNGFRTVEEQQELYSYGRTKPGPKKTNCDGIKVKSKHQSGLAIDFIPYPFNGWDREGEFIQVHEELSECARLLGFEPVDIIDWDLNHFELKK